MNEQTLFTEALEQTPAERDAFLARACGGDAELRERVEHLLELHARAGDFLEHPAPAGETQDPTRERCGTQIGPYKLLEQIGEGGFGVVYMAEQHEPVRRKVALKVLKPVMDSRQIVARFEAERQALALMDHPNIARVFDGGTTPSGRPYFVMELVKGAPITDYCDQHRLTPRQRLELFVAVCHAVQHAHQKGVIHRDIKPTNVLVSLHDTEPVVKVIDFGVAKALGQELTDKTLFTGFAQMVGTPLYMSPEQAGQSSLDIDTRSDIYSLGVLLYELLTGTTPFEKSRFQEAAYDEIRRIIREEEPPKPSTRLSDSRSRRPGGTRTASPPGPPSPAEPSGPTLASIAAVRNTEPAKLSRLIRGEIDWIVMKALEKDRNRRYETASSFAADLQRYLADEPVHACPPSAVYRLRKFARRNKGGLAVAALILFFLVLLGSGAGWAWRDRSAREAEAARQQGERQAKAAGQVESIFAEVDRLEGEQKWPEALAAARRAGAVVAGGEADAATVARVRERLKDLELVDRLEQIRMQRATWVDSKFDNAGADRDYARAFAAYGVDVDKLAVETSIERLKARPTLAISLGAALDNWSGVRRVVSEKNDAGWKRLVAVARGIDPEPLRDRCRSACELPFAESHEELRRVADSINIREHHPVTLCMLASGLHRGKRPDLAFRLLQDAQQIYPGDFWVNYNLATALGSQKDHEGAVRFHTAAVAIRPHSSAAISDLGTALYRQNKLDEAIASYRKAIEIDPDHAIACSNLGLCLVRQGKPDEAIVWASKAIEIDPKYADPHNVLGWAFDEQGNVDEAIACYRKAIELDVKFANAHSNLGSTFAKRGKLDDALACYRKAIELDPNHVGAHIGMGNLLSEQNKLADASSWYRKATAIDPEGVTAPLALGRALRIQGNALRIEGKLPEATATFREAVRLLEPKPTVHLQAFSLPLQELGWAQYRAGAWRQSIDSLEQSCKLQAGGTGDTGQWIVLALAHAKLATQEGLPEKEREIHRAEARRRYEEADRLMDREWPVRPADKFGQVIWDFREEARRLMGGKEPMNK